MSALPTTPNGALMRDSGLKPELVVLDARQQHFAGRLATACEGSTLKELYDYPTSGALVGRVMMVEHERGRTTETICWPDPEEEPTVVVVVVYSYCMHSN